MRTDPRTPPRRRLAALALLLAAGSLHAASHRIPLPTTHNAIPGADGDTTELRINDDGTRELFRSAATNLVPGVAPGRVNLFLREGNTLRRLAPGIGGVSPDADVLGIALSRDGAYAAFLSRASNLVSGDSGSSLDLFRLHIDSGTLERFPLTQGAGLADGDRIELSRDGSRACLVTPAALVDEDTAGYVDAYLLNFDPPIARRMSDAAGDANGNGHVLGTCRFGAETPASSNAVVFASAASNLVAGDSNGNADIFLRSTSMAAPLRISLTHADAQTTGGDNGEPWLIANAGRRLLFWRACAGNVVPDDEAGQCDIFRRDIDAGGVLRLSRGRNGEANGPADRLVVSPDGAAVAFRSRAGNVGAGARANAVVIGFESSAGNTSNFAKIDADASATLLPAGIATLQGEQHAYRLAWLGNAVDAGAGAKTAVLLGYTMDFTPDGNGMGSSGDALRTQGNDIALRRAGPDGDTLGLALSGDGRTLAFYSLAANLDAGAANAHADLFLLDLRSGDLHAPAAFPGIDAEPAVDVRPPAIDHDGTHVAFVSQGLLPEDTNGGTSLYLWSRDATPALTLLSRNADGEAFLGHSSEPSIDATGTRVVFSSDASNAVAGDFLRHRHVYLVDVASGAVTHITTRGTLEADGDSFDPQISADGRLVTFCSRANDLVGNDTNAGADLFAYDVASGERRRLDPGTGATCHARLAPSGDLVLNGGVFLDPATGANPDAVGALELGRRPVLDFGGRVAAGIEVAGGIEGLVKTKRVFGPDPAIAPIGPRATPASALVGLQGDLALSHDGRTLYLTSRGALDPTAPGTTRMKHLYRHLPFDLFFDGLED